MVYRVHSLIPYWAPASLFHPLFTRFYPLFTHSTTLSTHLFTHSAMYEFGLPLFTISSVVHCSPAWLTRLFTCFHPLFPSFPTFRHHFAQLFPPIKYKEGSIGGFLSLPLARDVQSSLLVPSPWSKCPNLCCLIHSNPKT